MSFNCSSFNYLNHKHLFWLVLGLALLLRLPFLNGSFWLDEAAQALESLRPLSQQLEIIPDFQPPLLHLLVHFAIQFSTAEWWLRTVGSLIPGLITIIATYWIGKSLFNQQAGLLAALFLATSSLHIFFSQELRQYSLPAMWAVISWIPLLPILEEKNRTKKQNGKSKPIIRLTNYQLISYALISTAGLYTSYLYPFFLLSQTIIVIFYQWTQKNIFIIKQYFLTLIWSALAFSFWMPKFFEQLAEGTAVRTQLPGWSEVVSTPQLTAIPMIIGKFFFGIVNLDISLGFILPLIFITILLFILYTNYQNNHKSIIMIILWLTLPIISAWIISFIVPVLQPKRVLFLLPAMYLLFASLISHGWTHLKIKPVATAAFVIILLYNLTGTLAYYSNPNLQRENWRSLHQEITDNYPPDRTIMIFSFPAPFSPWVWYDQMQYSTISTGYLHIDQVEDLSGTLKVVTDYEYIIVFDYLRDLTDPDRKIEPILNHFGFQEGQILDYPNIGFIRIFLKDASA